MAVSFKGQAFGVGALHSEDADIYAQDSLASYDFSIGTGDEHDKDDDEDDEMAELEAARHGRFSDLKKRVKNKSTIDGWTPPTRKLLFLLSTRVKSNGSNTFFFSPENPALRRGGWASDRRS